VVLDKLAKSRYAENTLVVVCGDHGWFLGEKLRYRKTDLWQESTRVPLIVRVPGLSEKGIKSNRLVNLLDLYPTLAELCGLPVAGGGRNELPDAYGPHLRSELAPALRASFARKPPDGYFLRAEVQAHFASLLEQRRQDPDFLGDPFARYGGASLHTRSVREVWAVAAP
jgi:arylsulfatase A-like enzyme